LSQDAFVTALLRFARWRTVKTAGHHLMGQVGPPITLSQNGFRWHNYPGA